VFLTANRKPQYLVRELVRPEPALAHTHTHTPTQAHHTEYVSR
jgi:hypothetical protein